MSEKNYHEKKEIITNLKKMVLEWFYLHMNWHIPNKRNEAFYGRNFAIDIYVILLVKSYWWKSSAPIMIGNHIILDGNDVTWHRRTQKYDCDASLGWLYYYLHLLSLLLNFFVASCFGMKYFASLISTFTIVIGKKGWCRCRWQKVCYNLGLSRSRFFYFSLSEIFR